VKHLTSVLPVSADCLTMSRECASIVIMLIAFWRGGFREPVRVTEMSLVSWLSTCFCSRT
jgi:hypothetical protein